MLHMREEAQQKKHDALIGQLPQLDFTNDVAMLEWLCKFQGPSEHPLVTKETRVAIDSFSAHGFSPMDSDPGPDYNDRDAFARYIIGQALRGLTEKGIDFCVHDFTVRWKKKFVSKDTKTSY